MKSKAIIKIGVSLCLLSTSAFADWKDICGTRTKRDGEYTIFTPNKNTCGSNKQRSEIKSKYFRVGDHTYNFETYMSIDVTKRSSHFAILQLHDNRGTCAPPLKVEVMQNNKVRLRGDSFAQTEEACGRDKYFHDGQQYSSSSFPTDGTPVKVNVIIDMEDDGSFKTEFYMNDQLEAWGTYDEPIKKKFAFQHGVYAQRDVDFLMKSDWELRID